MRRRFYSLVFASCLCTLVGAVVITAAQAEERAALDPATARKAATLILARCAVCHTTDLISQQRLPQDRWTVTMEKMMHWGADLSKEEAALLVQYLAARNHPGAPDQLPSFEHELAMTESFREQSAPGDGSRGGVAAKGAGLFAHIVRPAMGKAPRVVWGRN